MGKKKIYLFTNKGYIVGKFKYYFNMAKKVVGLPIINNNDVNKNIPEIIQEIVPIEANEGNALQNISNSHDKDINIIGEIDEANIPEEKKEKLEYFSVSGNFTSGPRKTDDDLELGEDVCGFIQKEDLLYFWMLDGTSDSPRVLSEDNETVLFSCRVLATQLGHSLRKYAIQNNELSLWYENALNDTFEVFQERLETNKEILEDLLGRGLNMTCTLIAGILNKDSNVLKLLRIGDTNIKAYDIDKNPLDIYPNKEIIKDNVILEINKVENDLILIKSENDLNIREENNIKDIYVFTDGISKYNQKNLGNEANADLPFRDLNFTFDDKMLLHISINN